MLRCHCACSSEIGTCIINDAGRQLHTKTTKISVLFESRQTTLYTDDLKAYINFQWKIKLSKNYQSYRHYAFITKQSLNGLNSGSILQ